MGEKFIAMSKTVWGIIVTIMGVLAQTFSWDWWGLVSDDVGVIFNLVVALVGAVMTLWGRFAATDKLTVLPPKP